MWLKSDARNRLMQLWYVENWSNCENYLRAHETGLHWTEHCVGTETAALLSCSRFQKSYEFVVKSTDVYIFFWIPYWPRMLINILWHPLGAEQYGGHIWRTGSIFSCSKGLWDCLPTKPVTTKHQSVFWLVSQSRMSAIYIGSCRWISLVAVVLTLWLSHTKHWVWMYFVECLLRTAATS